MKPLHTHITSNQDWRVGLSARFPLLQAGILRNVILSGCPENGRPCGHSPQAALGSEMQMWLEPLRQNVAPSFTSNL